MDSSPPVQFDRAERESSSKECSACQAELTGEYFEVNGQAVCPDCRRKLESAAPAGKGGAGALGKAALLGVGAGLVGTAIYYGVLALTGYEVALIAIVVGWLVGRAVFLGSGKRGGRRFQVMAVAITYFAICASYVPMVIEGLTESAEESAMEGTSRQSSAANQGPAGSAGPAPGEAPDRMEGESAVVDGEIEATSEIVVDPDIAESAESEQADAGDASPQVGGALSALVVVAVAMAAPFVAGFDNILGLLIIGFGLWQAWRGAKAPQLEIAGPFAAGSKPPAEGEASST